MKPLLIVFSLAIAVASCACKSKDPAKANGKEMATEPQAIATQEENQPAPRPQYVVLTSVAMAKIDPDQGEPVELYDRDLAQAIGLQLTESGYFVSSVDRVPDDREPRLAELAVKITYDVVEKRTARAPNRKSAVAVAAIETKIEWADGGDDPAPQENVLAERPLTRKERARPDDIIATHVAASLAQAGRGLIAKERVRSGGDLALIAALEEADVDLVLWSLELIGQRKRVELFDHVVAKLESENLLLRDHSLTALVALGDPRAVDFLAKRASFDDLRFMQSVIEAAVALGGDDAREYLEFVASGHSDDDIKARARNGLKRLARPRGNVETESVTQ